MAKKDFLEEKYCEINKLKNLLQVYPKEYCNTIIKVMNNVFDEITDYLKEKQQDCIKLEKKQQEKIIEKKNEVKEKIQNIKCTPCEKIAKHKNRENTTGENNSFTLEELAEFNGKNGEKAYVAINGVVYDVSNILEWKNGSHYGMQAGKDLSEYINVCHCDNKDIMKNAIVVGKLVEDNTREERQQTFTLEELAKYDGKNNSKAYVAINGTVYDVTGVEVWNGGKHYGVMAGRDLSQYFNSCHKSEMKLLENLRIVGTLIS